MSPWHAALKRSSTLRAYFAGIADSVPQNTAPKFSIIERLVLERLVFENTLPFLFLLLLFSGCAEAPKGAQLLIHPRLFQTVYTMTGFMRFFAYARPSSSCLSSPNNS